MMGIGFPELMIILVIIMIIFGAGKLPEIGSAFGNSIRNFKKSIKDAEQENEELPEGSDTQETSITDGEPAAEDGDNASSTETPVSSTTETEQK